MAKNLLEECQDQGSLPGRSSTNPGPGWIRWVLRPSGVEPRKRTRRALAEPQNYQFTPYFENEVLRKRPYLVREWCIRVIENPLRIEEQQGEARVRFWGVIDELAGRVLRVVTLEDRRTIHNAFPDRRFKP